MTRHSGPAKDTFVVGAAVKKGPEDGQNKAYCQVCGGGGQGEEEPAKQFQMCIHSGTPLIWTQITDTLQGKLC